MWLSLLAERQMNLPSDLVPTIAANEHGSCSNLRGRLAVQFFWAIVRQERHNLRMASDKAASPNRAPWGSRSTTHWQ